MTDLTGKQIANTYKQLLKIAVSTNTGVSTALQTVQSGDGTNSALKIGTGGIAISGSLSVTEMNVNSFSANAIGVSARLSATNIVAETGSFTTKVSGEAAEFSGNVCAGYFFGDGSGLTNVSLSVSSSVAHFTANTLDVPSCASITNLVAATGSFTTKVSGVAGEFSGTVSAATFDGNLTGDVTGDIDGATGSFSACISATNLVAATGSFTTKVSGVAAEFSGNVCASEYYGDGSNLTGITAATSVAAMTINTLGVVTAASITSLVAPHGSFTTKVSGVAAEFSGIVSALTFDGALTGDVTGDLSGNVTGDIDGATGSFSACISSTNLVAATGSFTTKVSGVAAEFSGNVCASEYYGDGSNLSGIAAATSVASFTVNQLGVVTAASITSLVAPYGSFTTKVSGVAAEFSGIVSALTFDGALTGDVTGDLSGNVTGDIDGATGSFSACISSTNLVAATGSFTTKVSGVAAEFSGTVCAATFDGALTGDVTGDIDGATGSFSACISATNLIAATGSFTTKVSGTAGEISGAVSVGGGLWTEGGAVFNEAGADVDFRVESDGNTHMLFVDAASNAVGVGTIPSTTEILKVGTDSGVQGTQYDIIKYQGYGTGPITGTKNTSVGTAATTILNIPFGGVCGGLVFVTGGTDPNTFSDTVQFHGSGSTPTTIASNTKNSPPARTYSVSGNDLQLAYASGTHNAAVWYVIMRSN
jgi:hypothetical protein